MGAQLEGLCSGRWGQNPSEQASVLTPSPLSPRPGKLEAQQQSLDVFGRSGREEIWPQACWGHGCQIPRAARIKDHKLGDQVTQQECVVPQLRRLEA